MNRTVIYILIFLGLIAALTFGVGLMFQANIPQEPITSQPTPSTSTDTPTPTPSTPQGPAPRPASNRTTEGVRAAYLEEVAKHPGDNTKLYKTVIAGDYALQVFAGDVMGGQALLKYDSALNDWVLLNGGGGAWSAEVLVDVGVPRDVAESLLSQLEQ